MVHQLIDACPSPGGRRSVCSPAGVQQGKRGLDPLRATLTNSARNLAQLIEHRPPAYRRVPHGTYGAVLEKPQDRSSWLASRRLCG